MGEKGALPALRLAPLSSRDAAAAAELFHETVHAVNARDYTSEQLDAWAPGGDGLARRLAKRLLGQGALGAWDGSTLVGLGSLEGADLLDMLYVHRDYQGRGVARLLAGALEREARERGRAGRPHPRVHHGASVFRASGLCRAARERRRARGRAAHQLPYGEEPGYRTVARSRRTVLLAKACAWLGPWRASRPRATRSACRRRVWARRRPRSREARPWCWAGRLPAQARVPAAPPPPLRQTSGPRGRWRASSRCGRA